MTNLSKPDEWKIVGRKKITRFIRKKNIRAGTVQKIWSVVNGLRTDPFPFGSEKLQGRPGYKIRIGRIRLIYDVYKSERSVVLLNIDFRGSVYKEVLEAEESNYLFR